MHKHQKFRIKTDCLLIFEKNIPMTSSKIFLSFLFILFYTCAFAQVPVDTLLIKLDSLAIKSDSIGFQKNDIAPAAYNNVTKLNTRDYFVLLGSNIKQEFTKPFHMTKMDWKRFGIFTGVVVGAGFLDEPIQKEVLKLRERNPAVGNTGKFISNFGGIYEVAVLAGFGTYGIVTKNTKIKTTTLLASQAYITGAIVESVLKTISGRTRPNYYDVNVEAEPKFIGPFGNTSKSYGGKRSNSSFPSGHTTVAFAAATVFAKEYANHPIIPIIAYTSATLIGVSRITENKHWLTDVIVGAALGYVTGNQVVNNYHRYARISKSEKKKSTVSYQLNYEFGRMMPGITYHIR